MGKRISFIVCLLLGICCFGMTGFAADGQSDEKVDEQSSELSNEQVNESIELWIHTWVDEKKVEGTENLQFDVYDLTQWREKRGGDEKEDQEYLMDTYPTKESRLEFVQDEKLRKINQESYKVDGSGNVSFEVPRLSEKAAYLILASGETGNHIMLPIVLYLPKTHPETQDEATRFLINGKYLDTSKPPTPPTTTSSTPPTSETIEPGEDSSNSLVPSTIGGSSRSSTGKNFPSTNDLVRNFTVLGLLLILIGLLGIKKIQKKK